MTISLAVADARIDVAVEDAIFVPELLVAT
jgi:hypothetical protein